MKTRLILAALASALLLPCLSFAGANLKNHPSDKCDKDSVTPCCPKTTSSVDNGCVRITLPLGKTSVLSDMRDVQLKVFTSEAGPALSTPETLHVVLGYTFQALGSDETSAGARALVDFVDDAGQTLQFKFAEGSSLGIPNPSVHKDIIERLQMVDANGWATLDDPAYYDLYDGSGSRWRFMATNITGELGKLISYTNPRGLVLTSEDFGVDIIRAKNGLLRQVLAPSRLADITTRANGYTVTVYPLSDTDAPVFANGLYALPPHTPTEILTVDRGADVNHLNVTLKKGGAALLRYEYTFVNGDWTLLHPDGLVEQKEIYYSDDENDARMIKLHKNAAGELYSRTESMFVFKNTGYMMTNRIEGFGTAIRSTSWSYTASGEAIGKVNERKDSTGAWVKYGYDANGRRITETYPNRNEVITTSYTPVDPADQLLLNDTRPRVIIRTIDGIEVKRTYYSHLPTQDIVERCATQNAAYGADGNLRTVTTWYPADIDDHSAGRIKSVRYEDGQMDVYSYSWQNSVWTEAITRVHEQEPEPVAMQTTRRSHVYSRAGNLVDERVELMTAPDVWEQIDGVAYEYDINGKETKRTTFNGLITDSVWSGACCGKTSETAPDGTRTTFAYDADGRLVIRTVLDPNPIETHINYITHDRQIVTWTTNRIAQLGTIPLHTTYDALGRLISQTDELGNTTTYSYSADEHTTTIIYPIGSTKITVTDEDDRILSTTGTAIPPCVYAYGVNLDGSQWTTVYNGTNNTTLAWEKKTKNMLGLTIREETPGFPRQLEERQKNCATLLAITYVYDNGGRVLSQIQTDATNPNNNVIISQNLRLYNIYGNLIFYALDVNRNNIIDFAGIDRIIGYTDSYIIKNNAIWQESIRFIYPDFDSDRNVVTDKFRRKLTEFGSYTSLTELEDVHGNISVTTQAVDRETGLTVMSTAISTSIQPQLEIQSYGVLIESSSTTAITNHYIFDGLNRRIAATDGRGNKTTLSYNKSGQIVYVEDAAMNRMTYVYDQYGRKIETIDALNQSRHTNYDDRGNIVKQYGDIYPVWYDYDAENIMVAMATTRDSDLDPATVVALDHPSLDVTKWLHDDATRLFTQKIYADGKGASYAYTPDGKLSTRTWERGIATKYLYNAAGQLAEINYSDYTPDVFYTYDRLGRHISIITEGVSTNFYTYSTNTLELISETQNGTLIDRAIDVFGRENGIAFNSDGEATYAYDELGRFKSVSLMRTADTFTYSYLHGSSLISDMIVSSGHAWSRSYETNRDLIATVTNSFNGTLISAFDYINDELSRRILRMDATTVDSTSTHNIFGYNLRSEVVSAIMDTNTYGYAYDSIGNRIAATSNMNITQYEVNMRNQYTSVSSDALDILTYDDDGNLLNNGVWQYTWDCENRLNSVSSNSILIATYAYDHNSRRIGKFTENADFEFIYDGCNLVAEIRRQGAITNTISYVYGLDISSTLKDAGGIGGLVAVVCDSTVYFPVFDGNGNICNYVTHDGIIAVCYEYSPFGEIIVKSDSFGNYSSFRFSSKFWDAETALSYYGHRYYDPKIGRFLSQDPVLELGFDLISTSAEHIETESQEAILFDNMGVASKVFTDNACSKNCAYGSDAIATPSSLSNTLHTQIACFSKTFNHYLLEENDPIGRTDPTGLGLIGSIICQREMNKWKKRCEKDIPICDECMNAEEFALCFDERSKMIKKCMENSTKMFKACIKAMKPPSPKL